MDFVCFISHLKFSGTEKFLDEKIGLILPANSPYLNIFNTEIYRMLQMGFIQKWLSDFLPQKDRCSSKASSDAENHTVNLIDMQGCFLVLLAGIIELDVQSWDVLICLLFFFYSQVSLRQLSLFYSNACLINIKY